jgi:hypothetical protein
MLKLNEEELKKAIVEQAVEQLVQSEDSLDGMIRKEVLARVNKAFDERANVQIQAVIDEVIATGFEREYQKVTSWGDKDGQPTTIKKELEKIVNGYWSTKVDQRTGKASDSYGSVTRAEYTMTQLCGQALTEEMSKNMASVTGALKDGLRKKLAEHMDQMLGGFFNVKSLQDQGKEPKPW